jgi:hypothetical protein
MPQDLFRHVGNPSSITMSAEPQLVHTFVVVVVDWYTQFTADPAAAEVSDVKASHIFAFSDEDNTFLRFFVFSFDCIVGWKICVFFCLIYYCSFMFILLYK